jgi:hypothetical protein
VAWTIVASSGLMSMFWTSPDPPGFRQRSMLESDEVDVRVRFLKMNTRSALKK